MRDLSISKKDMFYISLSDYTEEIAINLANKEKKLIFRTQGEANKIESIVNIVIDSLIKGKRVLIVNDDINEINLLEDHLSIIKGKYLNINIKENIKMTILQKTYREIFNLSQNTGKTTISKLNLLSKNIEKKIDSLVDIHNILNTKGYCKLTLLEMYNLSNNIDNIEEYNYYRPYRIKKPFINYSYEILNNKISNILKNNIIKNYIKYRKFYGNKIFKNLNTDINEDYLDIALRKLGVLINNPLAMELPLFKSKYTEYFIDRFIDRFIDNENISEIEIENFAKDINEKLNRYILTNKKSLNKKFNPLYWINYRKYKNMRSEYRIEFKKREDRVVLEYKENLQNIKIYIKAFDFLRYVLVEEEYLHFIEKVLKQDNVTQYLISLKDNLTIFKNFNIITESINKLDDTEREILDYCYNNLENKNEMEMLLKNIPNFHILLNIEEIQVKHSNIIDKYKAYSDILENINLTIENRSALIPQGIKYIWDAKILKSIEYSNDNLEKLIGFLEETRYLKKESEIKIDSKIIDIINNTFPCVISNSSMAKDIIENNIEEFDLIITCNTENINDEFLYKLDKNNTRYIIFSNKELNLKDENIKQHIIKTIDIEKNLSLLINDNKDVTYNNRIQEEGYNILINSQYLVKTNILLEDNILPLVVFDKKDKNPILVIDFDNLVYSENYRVLKNDIYINRLLEKMNIKYFRVWSIDWWKNKNLVINSIYDIIK
ncbi:hypothetical protein K4H75_00340 [Clostridium chauvoei]|uniref:hypothetical protein n=1 Tax=Clostridium chauvoei TaxID=46867 RepID=UPI001C84FF5D|nr:hypothetical protein [Clostridium chauvoei]MBX7294532.1 hypothetical protein [Clostridium chauvoei]